ncbi:hypothetical protein G7Y89_g7015 [Cudoniella acicularis]|uniref:WW domain-containing protein n=1 Tax=Cudoniella acicularis TaxID=354080 RepID=A0A8H4RK61_9HELO|nr:hypothetical protein G7Y89_g7015 [Cudoniella acicularis]
MDPFSIAISVGSIVGTCLTVVKKLKDVHDKFKAVPQVVTSLHSEARITGVTLSHLQSILLGDADTIPSRALLETEVLSAVDIALVGCSVTLSCLEDEIRSLVAKLDGDHDLGFTERAGFVFNDDKFKELLLQLRGQCGAISFLLQGLQMKSLTEIHRLVHSNQTTLENIANGTQSLRGLYPQVKVVRSMFESPTEVDSVFGTAFPASTNKEFEFDDMATSSQAYRRVLNAAAQDLNRSHQQIPVFGDDLLDLGPLLVDFSENAGQDSLKEERKPSHELDLLMLPIGANEASALETTFRESTSQTVLPEDRLSEQPVHTQDPETLKKDSISSVKENVPAKRPVSLGTESPRESVLKEQRENVVLQVSSQRRRDRDRGHTTSPEDGATRRIPKLPAKTEHVSKSTASSLDNNRSTEEKGSSFHEVCSEEVERLKLADFYSQWERLESRYQQHLHENPDTLTESTEKSQIVEFATEFSKLTKCILDTVINYHSQCVSLESEFQHKIDDIRAKHTEKQELLFEILASKKELLAKERLSLKEAKQELDIRTKAFESSQKKLKVQTQQATADNYQEFMQSKIWGGEKFCIVIGKTLLVPFDTETYGDNRTLEAVRLPKIPAGWEYTWHEGNRKLSFTNKYTQKSYYSLPTQPVYPPLKHNNIKVVQRDQMGPGTGSSEMF